MAEYIIGVDLGATKILTGIATPDGNILFKNKVPTLSSRGAADVLDRLCKSIETVVQQAGVDFNQISGIAVATPGPFAYPEAIVRDSPNLEWDYVPIKEELSRRLKRDIIVDKDTNMAVLGEYYFGQNKRYKQMLYITVSTGVGGGIIIDGQLYRGANGGAGEFGHMVISPDGPRCGCGRRGCLEALASGTAMEREAAELILQGHGRGILAGSANGQVGVKEIGIAARKGDSEARDLINRASQYLATGMANLVNIFNPEIIVLGGGVAFGLSDLLIEPTTAFLHKNIFSLHQEILKIELSRLGEDIGLFGCIAAVLQNGKGL